MTSISGATFSSILIVKNDTDRSTGEATEKAFVSYRVANDEGVTLISIKVA